MSVSNTVKHLINCERMLIGGRKFTTTDWLLGSFHLRQSVSSVWSYDRYLLSVRVACSRRLVRGKWRKTVLPTKKKIRQDWPLPTELLLSLHAPPFLLVCWTATLSNPDGFSHLMAFTRFPALGTGCMLLFHITFKHGLVHLFTSFRFLRCFTWLT